MKYQRELTEDMFSGIKQALRATGDVMNMGNSVLIAFSEKERAKSNWDFIQPHVFLKDHNSRNRNLRCHKIEPANRASRLKLRSSDRGDPL